MRTWFTFLRLVRWGICVLAGVLLTPACSRDQELPVTEVEPEALRVTVDGKPVAATLIVSCPAPGASTDVRQAKAECVGLKSGTVRDVTQKVSWSLSSPGSVTLDRTRAVELRVLCPLPGGGPAGVLSASGECGTGSVELGLLYEAPRVLPDTPMPPGPCRVPDPGDPNREIVVVHPLDRAMHLLNVNQLTFQWRAPETVSSFRLDFRGDYIHLEAYVHAALGICAPDPGRAGFNRCSYALPPSAFRTVAQSARGLGVLFRVEACPSDSGALLTSAPTYMPFSPEPANGTLYWGSASRQGIVRKPMAPGTQTEPFMRNAGTGCVGCHAISPDGKRVALTAYGYDGFGAIADTATERFVRPPLATPYQRWNAAAFSPDGRLLLTGWGGQLTLRDGVTGAKKRDIDPATLGGRALQPAFSPDGKSLVFVRPPLEGRLAGDLLGNPGGGGDWVAANSGDLVIVAVRGEDFEAPRVVVPSAPKVEYHYAPSFSPDSAYVLFLTATAPGSSPPAWNLLFGNDPVPPAYRDYVMTYGQTATRLRIIRTDGITPLELTAATHGVGGSIATPRFATMIGESLALITFAAKLPYGHIVPGGTDSQIWTAAIDLDRAGLVGRGGDPSYAPVWFPYQDPRDKSFAPFWR